MKPTKKQIIDTIYYILLVAYVIIYAIIFEKEIQSFISLLAFVVIRMQFSRTWRMPTTLGRVILIGGIYSCIIQIMPSVEISIFSGIIFAFIIDYLLYGIKVSVEIITDYNKEQGKKEDIHKMEEETLRAYLKSKGITPRQIDLVVLKVIYQIKGERLIDKMLELGYSCSHTTIVRDTKEIKKILKISKI